MKKTLYDYKEVIKELPLKSKYTRDELLIDKFLIDKENNIEIYYVNSKESKLLNIKNGEPGFKVSNINYDKYGNIIENSVTLYRGDLFMFSYEVSID